MKPYDYQEELAREALKIIKSYGLVYLGMEERTGKTLTAIRLVELSKANRCLILTKKRALMGENEKTFENATKGWAGTLNAYIGGFDGDRTWNKGDKFYTLVHYQGLYKQYKKEKRIKGKLEKFTTQELKSEFKDAKFDVVILDESHAFLSAYPKLGVIAKLTQQITYDKPIILSSATPNAQSYAQLFHQFNMSKYSPFDSFPNFYKWFNKYGIPEVVYTGHGQAIKYDKVKDEVWQMVKHLFITKTRKELGFKHEPEDIIHWVKLSEDTLNLYDECEATEMLEVDGEEVPLDSSMKLRTTLHQIESGVYKKVDGSSGLLKNAEKIEAILRDFGDTKDLVIMYHYQAELIKLQKYFKNALLLQGTSYAEGVDLSDYQHLVILSQDFSTAKHSQRRARQANKNRNSSIKVHFYLVKGAISEQVYTTVSVNKKNFIDKMYHRRNKQ